MGLYHREVNAIYKPVVEKYLKLNNYSVLATSIDLGISRNRLYAIIDACNIEIGELQYNKGGKEFTGFNLHNETIDQIKDMIFRYFSKNKFNITSAAEELGISRRTLAKYLDQYGLR